MHSGLGLLILNFTVVESREGAGREERERGGGGRRREGEGRGERRGREGGRRREEV